MHFVENFKSNRSFKSSLAFTKLEIKYREIKIEIEREKCYIFMRIKIIRKIK